jgi:hypothetical protein
MEEEPEIQDSTSVMGVPTSVEEQLNTETSKPTKLNKNGKPRKQLSPEALERLAKAREKANAMRQQAYAKKLEEKVEKIKIKNEEVLTETTNEVIDPEPAEVKDVVEKKVKPKEKGKKKTKIIIEQSSDDSDEFEPNTDVVFVKRVSRKKKEVPAVEPEHQMDSTTGIGVLPPAEPPRPPRPELTPQQRILKSQYEGMFGGAFMNNNLMRRHY